MARIPSLASIKLPFQSVKHLTGTTSEVPGEPCKVQAK